MLLNRRIDKHKRSNSSAKNPKEDDQRGGVQQREETSPPAPRARTLTDWEAYEVDSIDPYPTRH
jgi:hypothetical protein